MKENFRVVPDYQVLVEKKTTDTTGKYIETQKNKSYHYKIKLTKEGLKMVNKEKYTEFVELCFDNKEMGRFMFNLIHSNTNRDCMLTDTKGQMYTTAIIEKKSGFSRAYVNRTIKKLVENGFIKRLKKNFMISPFIFYPYVSDINLKILQEYWDNDFAKTKEQIGSEIQVEVNKMLNEAKDFIGSTSSEFNKIKAVKDIT